MSRSTQPSADPFVRRLALLLGWSVALHLGAWLVLQHLEPRPPGPPPKPPPVDMRLVHVPPKPPEAKPPDPRPVRRRPRNLDAKELARSPASVPDAPPVPKAEPATIAPVTPEALSTPDEAGPMVTAGGDDDAALAERARGVRLFDTGALGSVAARRGQAQVDPDELLSPSARMDGPAAEEARVGARLASDIDVGTLQGAVRGGLVSECGDGIDQGLDDEVDCATPGCRLLPVCRNTQVFDKHALRPIPDDDTLGVFSEITVPTGGTVRAVSVKVRFAHASPGDLAIVLEGPGGQRAILRRADRSESRYARAFYVRDFAGEPVPGRWKLRVIDAIRGTSGLFKGWQLVITG